MDKEQFSYQLEDGTEISTLQRTCEEAPIVRTSIPRDDQVFFPPAEGQSQGKPNLPYLRAHFFEEGKLDHEQLEEIIRMGTTILKQENNVLKLPAPIIICGDIHGQYYDLIKLFDVAGGEPPAHQYLFLGDYVDRGYFSLECYVYLLALKINYPDKIFMLRGNHECRHLTKHFTFKLECNYKYGGNVYEECMTSFDALPLAAIVNKQFFCVHGGISPDLITISDLEELDRFKETPKRGLMCDLLWSDPTEDFGSEDVDDFFVDNSSRGCSYRYSYAGACNFLRQNKLLTIIRGHEAQDAGYRLYRQVEQSEFPALITMFSAPNYVDVYKNKGAVLKYDGKVLNIRQFNCAPHPYYLPKFMNVFDWSLPFVGEKVAEVLMTLLKIPSKTGKLEDLSQPEKEKLDAEYKRRQDLIKTKIRAIGRVNKMFSTVRNERETLTELMNVMGTKVIPAQYLTLGHEDLLKAIDTFERAKQSDQVNEMLPPFGEDSDAASVYSLGSAQLEEGTLTKEVPDTLDQTCEKAPLDETNKNFMAESSYKTANTSSTGHNELDPASKHNRIETPERSLFKRIDSDTRSRESLSELGAEEEHCKQALPTTNIPIERSKDKKNTIGTIFCSCFSK